MKKLEFITFITITVSVLEYNTTNQGLSNKKKMKIFQENFKLKNIKARRNFVLFIILNLRIENFLNGNEKKNLQFQEI